jgi:hypothetical protein
MVIQLRPQLFEQYGVLRSGGFSQKLVNDRHDSDIFREGASITEKGGLSALMWFCLYMPAREMPTFLPSLRGSSSAAEHGSCDRRRR